MFFSFVKFWVKQLFKLIRACCRLAFQCMLLGLVGIGLVSIVFGFFNRKQQNVEPGTILVLDLSDPIVELNKGFKQFQPHSIRLMDCIQGLEAAAEDERIAGLIIRADSAASSGNNEVLKDELWHSIAAFKAKKPVLAYVRNSYRQDYVLASIANKVCMHPLGHISLLGTGCEVIFWGEAFKKYGLRAHVFKCGRYKSATESFTQDKMSPESREQLTSILKEIWQHSVDNISQTRSIALHSLDKISKTEGILSANRALELGLIDAISHEDTLGNYFENAEFLDSKQDYRKLSLSHYAQTLQHETASSAKIALLYAEGIISNQKTRDWETLHTSTLIKDLRKLRAEDNVKAIVLRINSPGGEASASEDLRHEIELTKAVKPIIISMGPYAASGGYWAALGGSTIFAHPSTITGSIGVFAMLLDWQGLGLKHGITSDRVATSPLAHMYSSASSKTEAERRILQNMTDKTYDLFLGHVTQSRKMDLAAVHAISQGRIWSGKQALQIGLVDHLGTLKDALNYAAQGLEEWQLEEYPQNKGYLDILSDVWQGEDSVLSYALSLLPQGFQRLIHSYYDRPGAVFSLLDYELKLCF